jgi:hypothetical protein
MPALSRSAVRVLGLLVVLLCLGFVVLQLVTLDLGQMPADRWVELAGVVLVGGGIYGLVSFSLSAAWRQLLLWSGEPQAPAKLCHGIYGRAQLGKYLPGNIFSIAGRHFLGVRSGFSNRSLLWAASLEILGMTFVSGLLFAFGIPVLGLTHELVGVPLLLVALFMPLILPWIMKEMLQRLPKLRSLGLPARPLGAYLRLYGVFLLYLPFFLAGTSLLWWLLYTSTGGQPPPFLAVMSLASGAWLAGYVTPGASGGIGVRDALLILAFKPFVGEAVVFAVIAYRLATILGDVVYFLVALLFPLEPVNMPTPTGNISTSR